MKKIKGLAIIALLIAVAGISCKKDDATPGGGTGSATVTASLYGYDGTSGSAFKSTAAGIVKVGNILTLTAIKDGTTESITIILPNVTGTGK